LYSRRENNILLKSGEVLRLIRESGEDRRTEGQEGRRAGGQEDRRTGQEGSQTVRQGKNEYTWHCSKLSQILPLA
jgi:hypothetical protein